MGGPCAHDKRFHLCLLIILYDINVRLLTLAAVASGAIHITKSTIYHLFRQTQTSLVDLRFPAPRETNRDKPTSYPQPTSSGPSYS